MKDSPKSGESSRLSPIFHLNDLSLHLPVVLSPSQILSSPVTGFPEPLKRNGRLVRPSTASAAEKKSTLLPLVPNVSIVDFSASGSEAGKESIVYGSSPLGTQDDETKITFVKPIISKGGSKVVPDSSPSPSDVGVCQDIRSAVVRDGEFVEHHYDWATFISAYAVGRWDPHHTPKPPCSHPTHISCSRTVPSVTTDNDSHAWTLLAAHEAAGSKASGKPPVSHEALGAKLSDISSVSILSRNQSSPKSLQMVCSGEVISPLTQPTSKAKHPRMPLSLPAAAHHSLRSSLPNWPASAPDRSSNSFLNSNFVSQHSNPHLTTTAATLRWAAAGVNLAPLAIPSPEHELTDPMRGVTATIPGAHAETCQVIEPMTPGGTRRSRLGSFWHGTQDIEDLRRGRLDTIDSSPSEISEDTDTEHLAMPFPASAPLVRVNDKPSDDYFGSLDKTSEDVNVPVRGGPPIFRRSSTPLDAGAASVPAVPRRVCLTRQTSSPLPITTRLERYSASRVALHNNEPFIASRAAKEEHMYTELGYLVPPNPPDEWERRRALNKFNIWSTGPDLNFDRIAHLAKLVFNTKGVFVSLIDGNEQWFKSQWGMKVNICGRAHAFCAHAILQRGDEPMVVLDTHSDWRFAKHPLVTGPPRIRFYAGAPLRTQEGFNIGTLSVIDEVPREEFSPRQRHTLKEFAAIAMREMELWRDKIQLRIRDRIQTSMEQFSRECLEIETDTGHQEDKQSLHVGASMDRVYDRAAKLVKRTLDVEGVIVMDVSHCEILEPMSAEGAVPVAIHHGNPRLEMDTRSLSQEEYSRLNQFFSKYPEGKISEGIVPSCFRPFLPTRIQYALTVPIFNVDKRPFALICAYNTSNHTNRFLEGHELSYLRAIGVIILSAVLKRRMILADKAKSLFISNISHELRTPLHGILAAAELLTDTSLDANQTSFLQTVQACGTSVVEVVNHVLDFTKLSGHSRGGGVENVIAPSKVNLMQLVEEAVEGCWIGYRARMPNSEIGSVYSPPMAHQLNQPSQLHSREYVETVVEVDLRKTGWLVKCERGGIRRVLMNLLGNSLKFTSDGFVHVRLRQLPPADNMPENNIRIELAVLDSGKGISQNFLKNHLFHPFSQENPLQTGTGLGLAIVNNIVNSPSVGGKIEVWSEEGAGTEIKVIFTAEVIHDEDEDGVPLRVEAWKFGDFTHPPTVSLVAFKSGHKGTSLLRAVLSNYLVTWWGFFVQQEGDNAGDIVIIDEDPTLVTLATSRRDTSQLFIILSASLGDAKVLVVANDYERIGGFCRILYKPGGPSRLQSVLKICLNILEIKHRHGRPSPSQLVTRNNDEILMRPSIHPSKERDAVGLPKDSRHSEETDISHRFEDLGVAMRQPVDMFDSANPPLHKLPLTSDLDESRKSSTHVPPLDSQISIGPVIPIGSGGCILKSSIGTIRTKDLRYRVLVVEDNSILRNLLIKWLTSKGHEFRDAVDGREGVDIYESDGPFDVVLLDLSMPKLDGIGATMEIRQFESNQALIHQTDQVHVGILALTGMSSLENKRKAFAAGVDGYLVKPVAFKTLDETFRQLSVEAHT